jgi:hypothetical protein
VFSVPMELGSALIPQFPRSGKSIICLSVMIEFLESTAFIVPSHCEARVESVRMSEHTGKDKNSMLYLPQHIQASSGTGL